MIAVNFGAVFKGKHCFWFLVRIDEPWLVVGRN